jgi:RimJ/RimL family protein N-acetyltransferase
MSNLAPIELKPLQAAHAPAMLAWMRDPEVAENLGLRSEPSLERTLAWIAGAAHDANVVPLAIECDARHVGNVIIDRIDHYLGTGRLSIYIGEAAARGQKIGQRSLQLCTQYAFEQLGLHKIWLTVHVHNARAIAAYTAAGFAIEGVLRDEFILRGKRCNALLMGLLKSPQESSQQAA